MLLGVVNRRILLEVLFLLVEEILGKDGGDEEDGDERQDDSHQDSVPDLSFPFIDAFLVVGFFIAEPLQDGFLLWFWFAVLGGFILAHAMPPALKMVLV